MITEHEAEKKECRVIDQRRPGIIERCSASACMHWRFTVSEDEWEKIAKEIDATGGQSEFEPRYGYCGLAGKP